MRLPIRVALVGLAPLVEDIVCTLISSETDMCVVAVIDERSSRRELEDVSVDVCVVGAEPSDSRASEDLLGGPSSPYRVIAVSADGRQMQLLELRPATDALGSLSSLELLELIRRGHRHDAGDPPFNRGV